MPNPKNVTTARVDEVITIKMPTHFTVKAPCPNQTGGYWFCLTHDTPLRNGFETASHTASTRHPRTKHHLVWMCYEHGPEAQAPEEKKEATDAKPQV